MNFKMQVGNTAGGGHGSPTFCVAKRKLLKLCHQGQNVTVLAILERVWNSKTFPVVQPWSPTILFSVPL